jgi:hypothetical protein
MKDDKEQKPGDPEGTLDYQEPVLVRLDDRNKTQLGMCGVGVTGALPCLAGSAAGNCPMGANPLL